MNRDDRTPRPPRRDAGPTGGPPQRDTPRPRSARIAWEKKRAARKPRAESVADASSEAEPAPAPLRLAVLYGEPFAPFLASFISDLVHASMDLGHTLVPIPAERVLRDPARCAAVERLYVLPFDTPREAASSPRDFVRDAFPHATILNPMEVHELCWDKLRTDEHLLLRGIPVPESLFTDSAAEVRDFVGKHQFVILKERRSCGGQGHVILCDSDQVLVGEAGGSRFVVELGDDPEHKRRLRDGVLSCPPPFFVQRLVGEPGAKDVFTPGQILRAYVVDGRVAFWTERYRDHYRRPSDWIITATLGAKYRFVHEISDELRKLALRAADALGMRIGVIDLVRSGAGFFILEADTDGRHMYIDREFKHIPDYRGAFDLDSLIVAALAQKEIPSLAAPL